MPKDRDDLVLKFNQELRDKNALLLLDNVMDEEQVIYLIPPKSCRLIVTSRSRLALPAINDLNLGQKSEQDFREDAKSLLLKIRPEIGADAETLAELCGFLPLALCAAASTLRKLSGLSVSQFITRLRKARYKLLDLHDPNRNITVEAVLSISYELLTDDLKRKWRWLAVFPKDFAPEAVKAVWSDDDPSYDLAELESHAMLVRDEQANRYRLHDLARELAYKLLLEHREEEAPTYRFANHFAQVLRSINELYRSRREAGIRGLALFDVERENIISGQSSAAVLSKRDGNYLHLLLEYTASNDELLSTRLSPQIRKSWIKDGLNAARGLTLKASEADHLNRLGKVLIHLGEFDDAISSFEESLKLADDPEFIKLRMKSLNFLGVAHRNKRDAESLKKAEAYYKESLELVEDAEDRAYLLANIGLVLFEMVEAGGSKYRIEEAINRNENARAIFSEVSNESGEGYALNNLGSIKSWLGEPEEALDYHRLALDIYEKLKHLEGEGDTCGAMAKAQLRNKDFSAAEEYARRALNIHRDRGNWAAIGEDILVLSQALWASGNKNLAVITATQELEQLELKKSPFVSLIRANLDLWNKETGSK